MAGFWETARGKKSLNFCMSHFLWLDNCGFFLFNRLTSLSLELSWGEVQTENTWASALSEGSFRVWARMHHDDRTAGRG